MVEHEHICILYKPTGWAVTVDNRERYSLEDTSSLQPPEVVDGSREVSHWLARTLGASQPLALDASHGHGLLHRLDRGTSGLLCCARTYRGFYAARLEFMVRRVQKKYVCLTHGHIPAGLRDMEQPLLEGSMYSNTTVSPQGQASRTELLWKCLCEDPEGLPFTLAKVLLHTGRRHQIRAHLDNEGHTLVSDPWYGAGLPRPEWCPRLFLHAFSLSLDLTPSGVGGPIAASLSLPPDLRAALESVAPLQGEDVQGFQAWLDSE